MELLAEFLIELYMELMLLVIPEKNISKKHRRIAKILAVCVVLTVLGIAVWGFVLLFEYDNTFGIIPLAIAILLSVAQIVAGVALYNKHH